MSASAYATRRDLPAPICRRLDRNAGPETLGTVVLPVHLRGRLFQVGKVTVLPCSNFCTKLKLRLSSGNRLQQTQHFLQPPVPDPLLLETYALPEPVGQQVPVQGFFRFGQA